MLYILVTSLLVMVGVNFHYPSRANDPVRVVYSKVQASSDKVMVNITLVLFEFSV